MSEELKQLSVNLAAAAEDFLSTKGSDQPQLLTAHVGDELTLTILVCAHLTEWDMSERLGAALSEVAKVVMNEQQTIDEGQ